MACWLNISLSSASSDDIRICSLRSHDHTDDIYMSLFRADRWEIKWSIWRWRVRHGAGYSLGISLFLHKIANIFCPFFARKMCGTYYTHEDIWWTYQTTSWKRCWPVINNIHCGKLLHVSALSQLIYLRSSGIFLLRHLKKLVQPKTGHFAERRYRYLASNGRQTIGWIAANHSGTAATVCRFVASAKKPSRPCHFACRSRG